MLPQLALLCVQTHTHVTMHICTERDTQRHRDSERERERERETHTHTQIDRDTDTVPATWTKQRVWNALV